MPDLRREPFRLLFPLGVLLAWCGILPWVLFGTGAIRTWLGAYHAFTMTQGFLVAIAAGFLGTMLPRRTGSPPFSTVELVVLVLAIACVPIAGLADRLPIAEIAYIVTIATLAQFAIRRLAAKRPTRPPPPSLVLVPIGLLAGVAGAALLAVATSGLAARFADERVAEMLALGRLLVEQGLLIALVLALAPMLTPIICHGNAAPDPVGRARRFAQLAHGAAGLGLVASFVVEVAGAPQPGMALRAGTIAAELLFAARIHHAPTVEGLHRSLYRVALALVPTGIALAALRPGYRVAFLHLTFVGGLSLLVFAVSLHVAFLHTGREALANARPRSVALVGVLALAAACLRALAERFSAHYFEMLALASSLWLLGALVWGSLLVVMVSARRPAETA